MWKAGRIEQMRSLIQSDSDKRVKFIRRLFLTKADDTGQGVLLPKNRLWWIFFDIRHSKSSNAALLCRPKKIFWDEISAPFSASESGERYSANVSTIVNIAPYSPELNIIEIVMAKKLNTNGCLFLPWIVFRNLKESLFDIWLISANSYTVNFAWRVNPAKNVK